MSNLGLFIARPRTHMGLTFVNGSNLGHRVQPLWKVLQPFATGSNISIIANIPMIPNTQRFPNISIISTYRLYSKTFHLSETKIAIKAPTKGYQGTRGIREHGKEYFASNNVFYRIHLYKFFWVRARPGLARRARKVGLGPPGRIGGQLFAMSAQQSLQTIVRHVGSKTDILALSCSLWNFQIV